MKNHCEEILMNIQRTLHECRDNRKKFEVYNKINIHECSNIKRWSNDVFYHVGLKLEIKNPIIINEYNIKYDVKNRVITIH